MILGVLAGFLINTNLSPEDAKAAAGNLSIITDIFLRLIKMIIAPLVFSTLVVGIAHMEDSAAIGRVGVKTLGWFMLASLVSLTIGPGHGAPAAARARAWPCRPPRRGVRRRRRRLLAEGLHHPSGAHLDLRRHGHATRSCRSWSSRCSSARRWRRWTARRPCC